MTTNIYMDTEFTGLHQNTRLISIGLIDERERTFYAEFDDFKDGFVHEQDKQWITNNVLPHLKFHNDPFFLSGSCEVSDTFVHAYGDTPYVAQAMFDWLQIFVPQAPVHVWSDCLSYDWVLFNQLFGHAMKLPDHISYIPFDICTLLLAKGMDPDISREALAGIPTYTQKHNALWDARVIKKCYEHIMTCKG